MEQGTRKGIHRLHQLDLEENELRYEIGEKYSEQYVMERKLTKLKERRDELKKLLQIKPKQVLQEFARKRPPRSPKKSPNETVRRVLRSVTQKRLQEQCKAYRVTGISITLVLTQRIRVCFDTIYQGVYHEPYYMEIDLKPNNPKTVYRHTLPYFIPLHDLTGRLQDDTEGFFNTISDYLSAYISRRQQAVDTRELHDAHLDGELVSCYSFDYMKFIIAKSRRVPTPIEVNLVYDNLLQSTPTRVNVSPQDPYPSDSRHKLKELKETLKKHSLPDALKVFFGS